MGPEDVQQLFDFMRVVVLALGFLAGVKLGQSFSFWKW